MSIRKKGVSNGRSESCVFGLWVWKTSYKEHKERLFMLTFQTKSAAVFSTNCAEKSSYPLVLLSLQSPSASICAVKNMYESVSTLICHCLWIFRKCLCLMQTLHLCVKAQHYLVLRILLYYLHFLFYSKSHTLYFSVLLFQHSK